MLVSRLSADAVRTAYRRQAASYDSAFGLVSATARRRAVARVNTLAGIKVLEVGVGTGLALPHYDRTRRVTGIDLSAHMLERARERVASLALPHVEDLLEMDAEATRFADASFDIAAAMFVASVVPHPKKLLAELRRVVRPGGTILFINHFAAAGGVRLAVERSMAPLSHALGWHPDFEISELLEPADLAAASLKPMPPFGLFTLVQVQN